MIDFMDFVPLMNAFIPIAIIVLSVIRYCYTRRIGTLTLIPSLIYICAFYTIFIYASYNSAETNPEDFRVAFRVGLSMLLVSILIHITADIIAYRSIKNGS